MSGTLSAVHLIEQTAAYLCSTLTASVVSLSNALQTDHKQNLCDAVRSVALHLQLRHAAWTEADQPLALQQLVALAQGLPGDITLDASALLQTLVFPAATGRVVLNILLLAADSLPQGGRIILAGGADDLFTRIVGPAAAWPAGMTLCLASEAAAHAALNDKRSLQMAVTALLASAACIRLSALLPPATPALPAILRLGR